MERRKEARQAVTVPVWIEGQFSLIPCSMSNISMRGAQLDVSRDLALPKQFGLRLTEDGQIRRGCNVIWRTEGRVGVSFFRLAGIAGLGSVSHDEKPRNGE
jgi:hypothetical protein